MYNYNYYLLPYLNDDVQKFFMNIDHPIGRSYVKGIIEKSLGISVHSLSRFENEYPRAVSQAKSTTLDTCFIVNKNIIVDIEIQKRLDMSVLTDKVNLYQSQMIVSQPKRGKGYGEYYEVVQIILYNGKAGNEEDFVLVHHMIPKSGKTDIIDKSKICIIQMGNLRKIYKEKGIKGMTWLERMSFFIRYRFKRRYQREIKYILETEEEARYMEMVYERFKMNQAEYLRAVKKEIKEKAELDNAKLIGRKEGYVEGKQEGLQEGFNAGEKQGYVNGKQEGLYKAIKGLMSHLKVSMTEAMEMLSVSKDEYDTYIEMDKKLNK